MRVVTLRINIDNMNILFLLRQHNLAATMNRFENMEVFTRVVETGSISAAADQAGIAKSAVSRRLKELEDHLGVELFHRTTRRMNLTDTGEAFYKQARRLLDDLREAELSVTEDHSNLKGNLKVTLPSTFGLMHLGPAINEFMVRHPQIKFDLDINDRSVDLMKEGFDLAIRIANLPDSSLIARPLAPIRHVICASPEYLTQNGEPKTLQELAKHKCLAYNLFKNNEQWKFRNAKGELLKQKITPYLKASSGEFLRCAAMEGLGITQLPSFIVFKELERGTLVQLLNEYQRDDLNVYAVYPQTRHLSKRVRAFVDFLVERFKGVPYWDQCLVQQNKS